MAICALTEELNTNITKNVTVYRDMTHCNL